MPDNDPVNHPSHYQSKSGLESIQVIEAFDLGFCLGNAIKYILRAGKKDKGKEIEDLDKAIWYLQRRIEGIKAKEEQRRANLVRLEKTFEDTRKIKDHAEIIKIPKGL